MKFLVLFLSTACLVNVSCKKNVQEGSQTQTSPAKSNSNLQVSTDLEKNPIRFVLALKKDVGYSGHFPNAPKLQEFIEKFAGGEFVANPSTFGDKYSIITTDPSNIKLNNSCALSSVLPFYLDEDSVKSAWNAYFFAKKQNQKWFQVTVNKNPIRGGAYLCDPSVTKDNLTFNLHTLDVEPYFYDSVFETSTGSSNLKGKYPALATQEADGSYRDRANNITLDQYIASMKTFNSKKEIEKAEAIAKGCKGDWAGGYTDCRNGNQGMALTGN